jgi:hypothetical protein
VSRLPKRIPLPRCRRARAARGPCTPAPLPNCFPVVKPPPRGQIAQTYGSSEDEEDARLSEEDEGGEEAYGIGVVRPCLCRALTHPTPFPLPPVLTGHVLSFPPY